jgi:hypothetical protein
MNVRSLVRAALGLWFLAAFAAGAAGAFTTAPGTPPLPILVGALAPLAVFFGAYAGSRAFRALVRSADLRLVSAVQAWRAGGLGFIALAAHGVLPGLFAWPAGLGDIAIGLSAPWIALALTRERDFIGTRAFSLWNWLGILDLLVAVSMGVLSSGLVPGLTQVPTTAMTELPLVLIPTYFVPLFVMLHAVALFQARRAGKAEPDFSLQGLSSAAR